MSHRNAAVFALALSCSFAMPSFGSPLFGVSVIATGIGLYVTPLSLGRARAAVALAVILVAILGGQDPTEFRGQVAELCRAFPLP